MSFARAKRFDYKNPEITVSPADYYICSSLDKFISIHKSPRYGSTKGSSESGMSCSRCSRSCSTPTSQSGRPNSTYSLATTSASKRSSCVHLGSSSGRSPSASHKGNLSLPADERSVKRLISNFENLVSRCETASSQEFFDDDYFSYASSEELGHLKKIEEYELNQVRKAYEKLSSRGPKGDGSLLRKMEGIEGVLRQFGKDLAGIGDRLTRIEDLQKDHLETVKNVEAMKFHVDGMSDDRKQEITDIIGKAIDYLNTQFENRKLKLLHTNEMQILNVLQEMHHQYDGSIGEMREICNDTAADLTKELFKAISSRHLDAACAYEAEGRLHDCFNYENICKILSDHLQITKDEINILEQDSMDITLKYSTAQEALEAQTSFIEQLQSEIATLKKEVDN